MKQSRINKQISKKGSDGLPNAQNGSASTSNVKSVYVFELTMGVNVPQLIVHVEETSEALLSGGHRPVASQDIFVELQVCGGLCKLQQPRSLAKSHNDFPSAGALLILQYIS